MRDSKMVGVGSDLESIVDCGTFDPMGGGVFQFGLVLVASSTAVKLTVSDKSKASLYPAVPCTGEQPQTVGAGVNSHHPGSKSNERQLRKQPQCHPCHL